MEEIKIFIMPGKNEKANRKHLLNHLRKKAAEEFESSLPMSREQFLLLFEYLNTELGDKDCDDTNRLTRKFLSQTGILNSDNVLDWLSEKGGYCDCEILANVEDQF